MAQEEKKLPKHVAFIMDGNGRWAENQGKRRLMGHKAGAKQVRTQIEYLCQLQIPYVTLYAFSTENWKRPQWEVNGLHRLLSEFARKDIDTFVEAGVMVKFIGRRDRLTPSLVTAMESMERATIGGETMLLQVAVDYGGRDELVRAFNNLRLCNYEITESDISEALDTSSCPDPDLVIRTGGNSRVSNFMLWQITYSELIFTETLWPDFDTEELQVMLDLYTGVERRFGVVGDVAAE